MGRRIMIKRKRRAIEMKFDILLENFRWKCAFRSRRKTKVPTFDSCRDRKVFARIFVGGDLSSHRMQPFVAVSMIKVPVGIDQVLNRIGANTCQCFVNSRSRRINTSIDEKFPIAAGEHGNISTRTFKNADVAAQLRNGNLRAGSRVSNGNDRTFGGGDGTWICFHGYIPFSNQLLMNASRSLLMISAWVVIMPCGESLYVFSVLFLSSFADSGPAA